MSLARTPAALGYRMPAEWQPHAATWLTWPKDPATWPDRVPAVQEIFLQFIDALTPHERVCLLVDNADVAEDVRQRCHGRAARLEHLQLIPIETVDSWIRDYGPNFLLGPAQQLAFNHWRFNAWGGKYESLMRDASVPARLDELAGVMKFEPGLVLEGGSIDVNGAGTVLTTEQCLLHPNRNPGVTKADLEASLRAYLGVQQVVWLGEGIEGDDTDGHVDDITRFVGPDTIVTAVEDDPSDANHVPLRDNLARLRAARQPDGQPWRIVTLPMCGHVMADDERLPASYANFYIANDVLLAPVYGHANDAAATAILRDLFPTRRVVPILCEPLVWGMGSIHCVTQQQPHSL
ncbi:Agmatine deiminase [Luteitalea pratensis]|uniref:Agmatine deiminase n=1 Tax=Luteitalea pratensis TaxID=1855912 RepID=A0A143PNX7_LUTPR|nr:agmatine deiminase family protein [Luteitalea pratensis]AMY09883.1 Agmatine deiminase [Luteitalea pratensis]